MFKTKKYFFSILCLVFAIGIILRVIGVYPGFNPYHPDEGKAGYISAWNMIYKKTLDPIDYNYPTLVPLFELIQFYIVIFLLWIKFIIKNPLIFINNLQHLGQFFPNQVIGVGDIPLMYIGRYLTAFSSILTLFLTYRVSLKLFNSSTIALFSTFLLAINFRAVLMSHFDLPDTFNAFFLLLSFFTTLAIKSNPSTKKYFIAGIFIGLAISAKIQFFSFIPLMIVHLYISKKGNNIKQTFKELFSLKLIISFLAIFLTILFINLKEIQNFSKFYSTIQYEAIKNSLGYNHLSTYSLSYLLNIVLTPPITFIIFLSILVGIKRKSFEIFLIFFVFLSMILYFCFITQLGFYPRNFTAIIPFSAILGGYFLSWIYFKINKNLAGQVFFIVIISIISFQQIKNSVINSYYYSKPWNLTIIRTLLDKSIPLNKQIAAHPWDKYILFSLPSIDQKKNLTFSNLDEQTTYSLPELQEKNNEYALIGLDVLNTDSISWINDKRLLIWKKPDSISQNLFSSLSAQELFQHTMFATYKPWQAPENNYVFVRIPPHTTNPTNILNEYHFDSVNEGSMWKKIDGYSGKGNNLNYDSSIGFTNQGSLRINKENPPLPIIRFISPPFKVKKGYLYQAEGWVKSSKILFLKQRNGFLRIDFYSDLPILWNEETIGSQVALSSRFEGETWQKLIVKASPNFDAKWATLSFQISIPNNSQFWIDDISISESIDSVINQTDDSFKLELPKDVLYPYSNGGF